MTKFSPDDIAEIAEHLVQAKGRDHPAHFLIGAGCSISAGIPSAKQLIEEIHNKYRARCGKRLTAQNRDQYGACMALLSINERRDLIRPYLSAAKINWGTIALAQLISEGFVERVLTVNFDLVLENACGLLGLQPAVYDFGVAPASDPAMVVSPAIVHLHGQSYGLVLLNTEKETRQHQEKLRPILLDTLGSAPLVIIGYSGSADGISRTLLEEIKDRELLYWAGYSEDLPAHLSGFLEKDYFQYVGGADFDRFMIEVAQSLGCWPPNLFSDPSGHLLKGLSQVVAYPIGHSVGAIDLLLSLRQKLMSWQHDQSEDEQKTASLREFYMRGDYEGATKLYSSWRDQASLSDDDKQFAYWSLVGWGNQLFDEASRAKGKDAVRLFGEARQKYEAAVPIMSRHSDALANAALTLFQQARLSESEASPLLSAAAEKFSEALKINPKDYEARNNYGRVLFEQYKHAEGSGAYRLLDAAGDSFKATLALKKDHYGAMNNLALVLSESARQTRGEGANRLFEEAIDMFTAAAQGEPRSIYNQACVWALRGNEARCRESLENAEKLGSLPSLEGIRQDPDLVSLRDKPWFKELLARLEAKGVS